MSNCFDEYSSKGFKKMVLIGSDAPQLSISRIKEAFNVLDHSEIVVGPDHGGGMYLIGTQKPQNVLLKGIPWSKGKDFEILKKRCQKYNKKFLLLSQEIDIDTTNDLQLWSKKHSANLSITNSKTIKHLQQSHFSFLV